MFDPNDNLKRLLLALHAMSQNKRAIAALQALVATDALLTLFLFGQDYFGWWRSPMPPAVDNALVAMMTSLSLTLCGFLALIASLYATFQGRKSRLRPTLRAAQPASREFRVIFMPAFYGLPVLWGHSYLTGGDARLWGSLSVFYAISYQGCVFVLLTTERIVELRHRRSGLSTGTEGRGARAAVNGRRSAGRPVRPSVRFLLWRQWWRLTHPAYLRRMRLLDRSLYVAVSQKDVRSVAAYLTRGADPNLRLMFDSPLLVFAVTRGHAEVVRLLLESGADANAVSPSTGVTPLIAAAMKGDLAAVRLLLEHGAAVDARSRHGTTALAMAVRQNKAEVVRLLLAHGAPVDARSDSGFTALMVAASSGRVEVVRALLDAGADAAAISGKGVTALGYARRKGHTAVAAMLESGPAQDGP